MFGAETKNTKKRKMMEGFLWKYGGKNAGIKSYKRRYFKLQQGTLFYYETPDTTKYLGCIQLSQVRDFRPSNPMLHQKKTVRPFAQFALDLETPERVFVVIPETESLRNQWVQAIGSSIDERLLNDALKDIVRSGKSTKGKKGRKAKFGKDDDSYSVPTYAESSAPPGSEFELTTNEDKDRKKNRKQDKVTTSAAVESKQQINGIQKSRAENNVDPTLIKTLQQSVSRQEEEIQRLKGEISAVKAQPKSSKRNKLRKPLLDDEDDYSESGYSSSGEDVSAKGLRKKLKRCSKKSLFLLFANVIIMFFALGWIGAAGYALHYKTSFKQLLSSTSLSSKFILYGALIIGLALFFISVLGYFGLWLQRKKKGKFLLTIYFFVVAVILLVELMASVALYQAAGGLQHVKGKEIDEKIGSTDAITKFIKCTLYVDCCLNQHHHKECEWVPHSVLTGVRCCSTLSKTEGETAGSYISNKNCSQNDERLLSPAVGDRTEPPKCTRASDFKSFRTAIIDFLHSKSIIIGSVWSAVNFVIISGLVACWYIICGDNACTCCKKVCCFCCANGDKDDDRPRPKRGKARDKKKHRKRRSDSSDDSLV